MALKRAPQRETAALGGTGVGWEWNLRGWVVVRGHHEARVRGRQRGAAGRRAGEGRPGGSEVLYENALKQPTALRVNTGAPGTPRRLRMSPARARFTKKNRQISPSASPAPSECRTRHRSPHAHWHGD